MKNIVYRTEPQSPDNIQRKTKVARASHDAGRDPEGDVEMSHLHWGIKAASLGTLREALLDLAHFSIFSVTMSGLISSSEFVWPPEHPVTNSNKKYRFIQLRATVHAPAGICLMAMFLCLHFYQLRSFKRTLVQFARYNTAC